MKRPYNTQNQPLYAQSTRPHSSVPQAADPVVPESPDRFAGWFLLPLRLFLGVTFVYAGIQKLTDPQFFHKSTPGYIGNQIIAFAHGSPLHDLLIRVVVPHAPIFGWMIALGEMAIGLGALSGLLFRPAAFFGLLLSVVFFLTASWHAYPYFYGADIVFAFCWLTILLSGPLFTGFPSLDGWLVNTFSPNAAARGPIVRFVVALLVGGPGLMGRSMEAQVPVAQAQARPASRYSVAQRTRAARRNFIGGALVGGIGVAILGALGLTLRGFGQTDTSTPATGSGTSTTTGASGSSTGSGSVIAHVDAVPKNSVKDFVIPSSNDPGLLIHLTNGSFVAFDATCTHQGCPVDYDPTSQHLICPCHGAEYDPAQNATVLSGPTATPLTAVPIHVDSATGAITLQ